MQQQRRIEIFSAGCLTCQRAIQLAQQLAGPNEQVEVHDMHHPHVAQRADNLGVHSVPAILVDGQLVIGNSGPDEVTLRAAGLGQQIP